MNFLKKKSIDLQKDLNIKRLIVLIVNTIIKNNKHIDNISLNNDIDKMIKCINYILNNIFDTFSINTYKSLKQDPSIKPIVRTSSKTSQIPRTPSSSYVSVLPKTQSDISLTTPTALPPPTSQIPPTVPISDLINQFEPPTRRQSNTSNTSNISNTSKTNVQSVTRPKPLVRKKNKEEPEEEPKKEPTVKTRISIFKRNGGTADTEDKKGVSGGAELVIELDSLLDNDDNLNEFFETHKVILTKLIQPLKKLLTSLPQNLEWSDISTLMYSYVQGGAPNDIFKNEALCDYIEHFTKLMMIINLDIEILKNYMYNIAANYIKNMLPDDTQSNAMLIHILNSIDYICNYQAFPSAILCRSECKKDDASVNLTQLYFTNINNNLNNYLNEIKTSLRDILIKNDIEKIVTHKIDSEFGELLTKQFKTHITSNKIRLQMNLYKISTKPTF